MAPDVEGLHLLEELQPAPERADAARPAELVGRDRDEVGPERLDVHDSVRRALRRVADHDRPAFVGPRGKLVDRIHGSERIRHQPGRHDLDATFAGDLVEKIESQLPLVVERQHSKVGSGPMRDVLPGDKIRVVLELGHEYDIAGTEVVQPPGVRHEVDPLGRVPGEHHLARRRCVEEVRNRLARSFVTGGRTLGQLVHPSVDICVRGLVEAPDRTEHLAGLLGARSRVEEGKGLAVDQLLEDREVSAELLRVELRACRHSHAGILAPGVEQAAVHAPTWRPDRPSMALLCARCVGQPSRCSQRRR